MALYALGDLHLSFQTDKKMDMFGKVWRNHERKIEKNCNKLLTEEDTLVLVGDHSWGRNLSECEKDMKFIEDLPGRKILLRLQEEKDMRNSSCFFIIRLHLYGKREADSHLWLRHMEQSR